MAREISHFVSGKALAGKSGRFADVFDPATGAVQAKVSFATGDEVRAAVCAAEKAFPAWRAVNPQRRARVLFKFKDLVEKELDALARALSSEHGKILADAKGDLQRGLEVIEFACGMPHLSKGEYTEGAGPGIDLYSMRQPLGVCAGVTPFNFPAMIPMWMFGIAIACGNTFVLKPSEKDPSVPLRLAELMMEAGLPEGVLNVVNGDKAAVDTLLKDPRVKALSFVGSSAIAEYIYATGAANGKRVQAMGGAKNHAVILPDANLDQAVEDIVGAAYGSGGERCMALPVAVPVGDKTAAAFLEKLIPKVAALKVGLPTDPGANYGPLITAAHRQRVLDYVDLAIKEGQEPIIDRRDFKLRGYEQGFFLGPVLLDRAGTDAQSYKEEIFGPVLQIVRAKTFDEAVEIPSQHQYGNGVAVYTSNGRAAREFASRVDVGMVGINFPIPVPLAYHTFGGWKRSAFGDANQHGMEGVRFFTHIKTVTARWPEMDAGHAQFVIPTMR